MDTKCEELKGLKRVVIVKKMDVAQELLLEMKEKRHNIVANIKNQVWLMLKIKKCKEDGCSKHPVFGNEGEKAQYCSKHKKSGMVNVVSKQCKEDGCSTRSTFGNEGEKAQYCGKHKKPGMIDLKNKRCKEDGCCKQPNFGNEGEKAQYCGKHKKSGMIDLKNKRCKEDGCSKQPTFGNEGEKPQYCGNHKKPGMIDLTHKRCKEDGCSTRPNFGNEGGKAQYCVTHKKPGMIDVHNKQCKTPMCDVQANRKYDGYCCRCYIYTYPDAKLSRNYKTKEQSVVDYIQEIFPNLEWVHDRIISGGCSRRRPDVLLEFEDKVLIIEIDEDQHSGYNCENKRLMEISQDLGHRPCIFIRFNPDKYIKNNKVIASCWKVNKKGICVVRDKKKWLYRLDILKERINYWINNKNALKTIELDPLFFE